MPKTDIISSSNKTLSRDKLSRVVFVGSINNNMVLSILRGNTYHSLK